jgi:predicted Zn-dependent protease
LVLIVSTVIVLAAGAVLIWRVSADRLDRREGLRLARQGRFTEAEPILQRALGRDAHDLDVVKALALGPRALDRLTEADPFFERWFALRPADAEPYKRRMELRLQTGWLPQALDDARRVLELEPGDETIRRKVAHWSLVTGHYEDAEREARRCLQNYPDDPELLYLLANCHHRQGRNAEAQALLEALIRDYPRFVGPLVLRAILFLDADQPERAVPLLRQALALDDNPQQNLARYHLSQALARTGHKEEAQQVLAEMQARQAVELWAKEGYPNNPSVQVRVAEALLAAGKSADALPILENVVKQYPHSTAAHQLLATYYEKQGQADRAAEHRRRAGPIP